MRHGEDGGWDGEYIVRSRWSFFFCRAGVERVGVPVCEIILLRRWSDVEDQ